MNKIKVTGERVQAFNCNNIPQEHEIVSDYLELDNLMQAINSMSYYFRPPHDCPFGRGNWVIDFRMKDGSLVAYKYPKEMTEKRFAEFIKPLLDMMNK